MSDNPESEHDETAESAANAEASVTASSEPQPPAPVWVPALKEAALAFGAAAVVLVVAYVFIFRALHPEFVPFMDRENVTEQQFSRESIYTGALWQRRLSGRCCPYY